MFTNDALMALVVGVAVTAMVGCSASGPMFEPVALQATEAAIYVYRPGHNYMGSGVVLGIKIDGQTVGDLKNNGYVCRVVAPGRHEVKCTTEVTRTVPFQADSGTSYYIEAEVQMGFFVGRPKLTMVPEEHGQLAILGTKLCNKNNQDQPAAIR